MIDTSVILIFCPNSYNNLIHEIRKDMAEELSEEFDVHPTDDELLAYMAQQYLGENPDGDISEYPSVKAAWDALREEFKKETLGLDLMCNYLHPDDASFNDEVEGFFWEVQGMTQLTPAGEKCKNLVKTRYWTTNLV